MHDRNIFKLCPPNYELLARKYHDFRVKCFIGAGGKVCVNFADAESVRLLSQILLIEYFQLNVQLPIGRLVPRVPQRLNYILLVEDLICKNNFDTSNVWGFDIGTGASCIFPLLGARLNGWNFVATEVDANSFAYAAQNVDRNNLKGRILVEQTEGNSLLKEVMSKGPHKDKKFTFSMCNPPFFDPDEATQKFTVNSAGNTMTNLLVSDRNNPPGKCPPHSATTATRTELSYAGGESAFIIKMLEESVDLSKTFCFFTTMVGKMASLKLLKEELNRREIRWSVHSLCQGKTTRWVIHGKGGEQQKQFVTGQSDSGQSDSEDNPTEVDNRTVDNPTANLN